MRRFGRNHHRLARGQQRCPGSSLRIAGAKLRRLCGTDTPFGSAQGRPVRLLFAFQQSLRMFRGEPSTVFRDADGNDFVFCFIDCLQNRRRRQQRYFMLAAASAKEDANSKFCHAISVWRSECFPSITALVPADRISPPRRRGRRETFLEWSKIGPALKSTETWSGK